MTALTLAQAWGLPTRPTKHEGNSHARMWGDRPSVELDAIPGYVLRDLVRQSITQVIPDGALEAHHDQERRDRGVLQIMRHAAAEAGP